MLPFIKNVSMLEFHTGALFSSGAGSSFLTKTISLTVSFSVSIPSEAVIVIVVLKSAPEAAVIVIISLLIDASIFSTGEAE